MKTFASPRDFAAFLRDHVATSLPNAHHEGVTQAAEMLRGRVKAQLGQYLDGPEPGLPTAPLAEATKADRVRQGYTPDDPGLRSGKMRDSYGARVSEPGVHVAASIGSDDPHALWFEEGTLRQPPRPELSVAAIRHGREAAELIARRVVRAMAGDG